MLWRSALVALVLTLGFAPSAHAVLYPPQYIQLDGRWYWNPLGWQYSVSYGFGILNATDAIMDYCVRANGGDPVFSMIWMTYGPYASLVYVAESVPPGQPAPLAYQIERGVAYWSVTSTVGDVVCAGSEPDPRLPDLIFRDGFDAGLFKNGFER